MLASVFHMRRGFHNSSLWEFQSYCAWEGQLCHFLTARMRYMHQCHADLASVIVEFVDFYHKSIARHLLPFYVCARIKKAAAL